MSLVKQKLTVRSADRIKFAETVVEVVNLGATLMPNTVPKMIAPFMWDFEIQVERNAQLKSTPTLIAYPAEIEVYSVSQLESMVWDEFREAVGLAGVRGRDRQKMIDDYVVAVRSRTTYGTI